MKATDLFNLLVHAFTHRFKVLIKGPPGGGKTDIVKQAALAAKCNLILSHPAISDPTDYKGMPAVLKNGTAHFLPFGDLVEMIEAKEPTVVLMDDIGQATHGVQAALMQPLHGRRVNGHTISEHVVFCGATNDTSHRAGVNSILEPVKSRWDSIVELETDLDSWTTWAFDNDLAAEVIAFIRFRPDLLHDFKPTKELTNCPSPRTVAAVAKWVGSGITDYDVLAGAAGAGFASEFIGFLRVYQELPTIEQILLDPSGTKVPTNPAARFAIGTALVRKATKLNMGRVLTYLARLKKEFEVCAVRDIARFNPALAQTREFTQWSIDNQDALG